jgi:hypothetical protein
MAVTINADNGAVSGSAGLKQAADSTGVLALQTNGTTAVSISTGQVVTLTNALAEASGGTGTTIGYNGFKNRIINGAMVIDQRNAGASVTATASAPYTVDRFNALSVPTSKYTVQQSSTAPTGFTKSVVITSSSAYTVAATDYFLFRQPVEGFNVADLGWGTASAATVTLSFWVRSSLTGNFGGYVNNNAGDRSYPFSYTINSANTWEQKSVTIAGDTTGTWLTNSSIGLQVGWSLGMGSTYTNTANTWVSGFYGAPTGSVNLVATNGATFYITGVQLEKGSIATSFDYRPYGTELALCQRYCQYAGSGASGSFDNSTTVIQIMEKCVVTMRAAPSGAIYSGVTAAFRSVALDFTAASPALANFLANTSNVGGTSFWTQVSGFTGGTANAVVTARNNQTANGGNFILLTSEL